MVSRLLRSDRHDPYVRSRHGVRAAAVVTSLAIFLAMIVFVAVLVRTVDRSGPDDEPPDVGLEPAADSGLVTVSAAVGMRCRIVPLPAGRNRTRATARSLRERARPAARRTAPGLAVHHQEAAGPPRHVLRPLPRPNHTGETIRAPGTWHRSRLLILATGVVLLTVVTAAALPAAAARPTADRDFCPRRTSVTISDRGRPWAPGSGAIPAACSSISAGAVRAATTRWSGGRRPRTTAPTTVPPGWRWCR